MKAIDVRVMANPPLFRHEPRFNEASHPAGNGPFVEPLRQEVLQAASAYVAAGAVSNLFPAGSRALVSLCLISMLSMTASGYFKTHPRRMIPAVVVATAVAMFAIGCWRRRFDPMEAVGPIPPPLWKWLRWSYSVSSTSRRLPSSPRFFRRDAGCFGSGGSCSV